MTRVDAIEFLNENVKNQNLIKHMLACEAVMKSLYVKLNPDPNTQAYEEWALVGLLHDGDYEESKDHPEKHGIIIRDKLGDKVNSEIIHAIMAHNAKYTKVEPESKMDWSIYCCDELTGLIIAATLISPEKKIAPITAEFVLKRFNEKSFAKGAHRDQIKMCEEKLGIPLPEFIQIALSAMQNIAPELGL